MLNRILLQGRLVKTPEVSPENVDDPKKRRCLFQIAVRRDYKKENGPDTDFFYCVAFGSKASYLVRYGSKGKRVLLEGRVEINTVDNDNGSRSVYAQVVVENLWMLDYSPDGRPAAWAPAYDPSVDPDFFASVPDPSEVPFLNN